MSQRTLIVGLGSALGDDQAGLIAAEKLEKVLTTAMVRQLRSPAGLLDLFDGLDELHIMDACHGAGECGAILKCNWPAPAVSALRFTGTHDFDLVAALRLADELRLLPPRVTIWAIETSANASQAINTTVSPKVAVAIDQLVAQMVAALGREAQHA